MIGSETATNELAMAHSTTPIAQLHNQRHYATAMTTPQ